MHACPGGTRAKEKFLLFCVVPRSKVLPTAALGPLHGLNADTSVEKTLGAIVLRLNRYLICILIICDGFI
jgi:hypothetical protein